ncbi:MAG: hypothetical protein JXB49_31150 [Bacteroidales bacterium]|nr:hypothetical protein [Bacteroidales bacterium]MBN2820702.1 hypothetical protein [Bacteroidales bacterium]
MKKTAFIASGILLICTLLYIISGSLLTFNKPIKSPYILLEDWISSSVLEEATNYIVENGIDSIFIVGMKNPNTSVSKKEFDKTRKLKKNKNNEYILYWGGILGFEIPIEELEESFTLQVKMRGKRYANLFPHYRIFFNQQLINSGFVSEKDSVYQFTVSKNSTDSSAFVIINFDNNFADKTLFISDVSIDRKDMGSIMLDNFFISYSEKPDFNYVPKTNEIKNYIGDRGFDTSKVKIIEVGYASFNRTLALAKGAKKHFNNSKVKSINIITVNNHSRRSYINFNNCLEKNMKVGCIPLSPVVKKEVSFLGGLDGRVSLLLTWMYWWFH